MDEGWIEEALTAFEVPVCDGSVNRNGDNHIIIPIGMVRLDEENGKVYINRQICYSAFAQGREPFSKGTGIDTAG